MTREGEGIATIGAMRCDRELHALRSEIKRLAWARAEHGFSRAEQARYGALCREEGRLLRRLAALDGSAGEVLASA